MEFFIISMLNGLSYGLLLFMLSAGLTLIFSMMGVLNFAHASFYMLGAYAGHTVAELLGFWPAMLAAPLIVGVLGALFERFCLRKVHASGHVAELLMTFGLSFVMLELVQLVWGRAALPFGLPAALQGPAFTLVHSSSDGLRLVGGEAAPAVCQNLDATARIVCSPFPATRSFMMFVALLMLTALWLLLHRTRVGLVVQAALTHPETVQSLGHNVPRLFMLLFGVGSALAGLAGVIGGSTFVTEPAMAAAVGPVIFVVVVVGGLGSMTGAFLAALIIGVLQSFSVTLDYSLAGLAAQMGVSRNATVMSHPLLKLTLSQAAPMLPYLLLVVMLIVRPKGLLGTRE